MKSLEYIITVVVGQQNVTLETKTLKNVFYAVSKAAFHQTIDKQGFLIDRIPTSNLRKFGIFVPSYYRLI